MKKNEERFVKEWGDLLENHKMRFVKMHAVGMAIIFFMCFLLLAYFTDIFGLNIFNLLLFAAISLAASFAYGYTTFFFCKNYLKKIKSTDHLTKE